MITPLDIKKHEFTVKWRGYDTDEVHALLEMVAKDFEDLTRQNLQLAERLKISEERLNHYRLIEKTMQDSVLTLQTTLDEKRKLAEQEAGLVIQDARQKANDELIHAREHMGSLRGEIAMLENQKTQFFYRLRGLLKSQTQLLEAMMQNEEREESMLIADTADLMEPSTPDFKMTRRGEKKA